jgi:hypothetical protein
MPAHWTTVHPPFPPSLTAPVGPTFHPKLWLLDYGVFLRVVISSANAGRWEWDEVTQNIWVLDARPRPPGAGQTDSGGSSLAPHVAHVLRVQRLDVEQLRWLFEHHSHADSRCVAPV